MAVVIETTIGDFTVDLYTEERPRTCFNFLKLCKIKYYNWNLFHMIQSNFIAQTGDPTSTGNGGESIHRMILGEKARFYEGERMPKIKHDRPGLLSMVNCGDNMFGSQFFITLGSDLQSLDGEHCVFGEVAEGHEIILKFNESICDEEHRPYQDIRISHTIILEDPYDDPEGLVMPDRSPPPTKEVLMSDRIGADEVINDTSGMTAEEIMEIQKDKEAKARATILEIVGDLPDAEMAPPENVLFVCKLNPVTNDDDLEIIFSRFGKIIGCEVIRDRQTGDSLQYAFIEFADRTSCENAYFKMDNVLIDDRRIHVDFSQSVAKMRWKGKGKGIRYFNEKEQHERSAATNKQRDRNSANSVEKRKDNNVKRHKDTRDGEYSRDRESADRSPISQEDKDRRKYDRRKEKYQYESNRRQREVSVERRGRDDSCERSKSARGDKFEKDRRRRDEERDRDKSNRHSKRDYYVEREEKGDKYLDRNEERRDRRDKSGKTESRHYNYKKKRTRDESEERRNKGESKHRHRHN